MVVVLHDIRVVEVAAGVAGSVAGMLLADAGADVVRAERPGDAVRAEPGFAMWGRGKRSVTGPRRLDELLAGADVAIVDSGEPLAPVHPRLVVLHMPAWPGGVPWAGGAGSHGLIAAHSGVAMRQASWEDGPIELVYPHVLYVQGAWAAACAVAALLERERSGLGQVVTVSGAHGVLVTSSASTAFEPGREPRNSAVGPGGANPSYTRYRCADGRWLFMGALTPKFQTRALEALGMSDVLADPRVDGVFLRLMAPENRTWLRDRFSAAFATRPRDEWLAVMAEVDCPAGPLEERDGWLDHPQVQAIGARVELDDPERGPTVVPGNPLVFDGRPLSTGRPAPRAGEHDGEQIAWPARAARAPVDARSTAGPLAGIRVLDLGTILAGPFAGCLLADLGADVVKVEPPAGDSFRDLGFTYNRGMRSLSIDLRAPEGHRAFLDLVRGADAVIDNYRPGVLERLGIDHASLARANPGIVTMSITGYGEGGPLSAEPGFDPILQGRSGMMTAQGGSDEPVLHTIPVNDVAAAALTALGVCLALWSRDRAGTGTGAGRHVATSLAGIAGFMQGGELVRFAGRPPAPMGSRDHSGMGPLDRFVPVRDGWVRVQAPVEGDATATAAADEALAASLADLSRAEATERLRAAGIPAAAARRFEELPDDPAVAGAELLHLHHRTDGTIYWSSGRYALFSRTQRTGLATAPGLGEHSRAVLAEAGLSPSEIDALIASGTVVEGPPLVVRVLDYR